MGGRESSLNFSHPSEGLRKCSGGLSQQISDPSTRVESERGGLSGDHFKMGITSHRSVCLKEELQGRQVLLAESKRGPLGAGCILTGLEPRSGRCLSPNPVGKQGAAEAVDQSRQSYPDRTLLAEEELVPNSSEVSSGPSIHSSGEARPSTSGTSPASEPRVSKIGSLDPESAFLKTKGLSYKDGFEKGLRPSTLKVQVLALSAFYDTALAEHRNQEIVLPTFCQHPRSPMEEKWHLLDENIKARRLRKPQLDDGLLKPLKNATRSRVFPYRFQLKPILLGLCLHLGRSEGEPLLKRFVKLPHGAQILHLLSTIDLMFYLPEIWPSARKYFRLGSLPDWA
ncbi:uncharacterized protein [Engystomops pustulosus]|uniref:uncharacterized protein isoform X2 n=1 Tax=Engystomops pustulosus TaxID=76066 RepID=UPI003AFAEB09